MIYGAMEAMTAITRFNSAIWYNCSAIAAAIAPSIPILCSKEKIARVFLMYCTEIN